MLDIGTIAFDIKKPVAFYLVCSSLVLLWYKKLASSLDGDERFLFVLALGLGILLAALVCDGLIKSKLAPEQMIGGSGLLVLLGTGGTMWPGPPALCFLAFAGLFGGALFIVLQFHGLRNFPYDRRCLSFGTMFAASGLANTLTDLPEVPLLYVPEPPGSVVMAAVVMAVFLGVYLLFQRKAALPGGSVKRKGSYALIAAIAAGVSCIAYLSFSVKDSTAYPEALAAASASGFIRLIEVPLFLGIGWLCDRLGRHVMLLASLCLALLGSLGILFPQPVWALVVLEACSFFSMIAFSVSICVILGDLSHYAKHPALMISLGFAPLMVSQLFSLFPFQTVERAVRFLIAFVPCVLLIPAVTMLLEKVRMVYAGEDMRRQFSAEQLTSVPAQCGFTKREAQVYDLILEGKTVLEMSQALYLTESTVKQHISKILKKTGQPNRAQLIQAVKR